jgi:hypothetical protein
VHATMLLPARVLHITTSRVSPQFPEQAHMLLVKWLPLPTTLALPSASWAHFKRHYVPPPLACVHSAYVCQVHHHWEKDTIYGCLIGNKCPILHAKMDKLRPLGFGDAGFTIGAPSAPHPHRSQCPSTKQNNTIPRLVARAKCDVIPASHT